MKKHVPLARQLVEKWYHVERSAIVMTWFPQGNLTIHIQATIIIYTKQIKTLIIANVFGKKLVPPMRLMVFHHH